MWWAKTAVAATPAPDGRNRPLLHSAGRPSIPPIEQPAPTKREQPNGPKLTAQSYATAHPKRGAVTTRANSHREHLLNGHDLARPVDASGKGGYPVAGTPAPDLPEAVRAQRCSNSRLDACQRVGHRTPLPEPLAERDNSEAPLAGHFGSIIADTSDKH